MQTHLERLIKWRVVGMVADRMGFIVIAITVDKTVKVAVKTSVEQPVLAKLVV